MRKFARFNPDASAFSEHKTISAHQEDMENVLNSLERRFGKYAVPGLINYIIGFNLLCWILGLLNNGLVEYLVLDFDKVLQGQVWRLFTFWMPMNLPMGGLLWAIFLFFFIYIFLMMGHSLEREWGTFRFNLFWLLGILGTLLAALVVRLALGPAAAGIEQGIATDSFVNLSIFFAFATVFPKYEFLIFFILPVQVRWLALLSLAFLLLFFLGAPVALKVAILVAYSNYILFFGPALARHLRFRREVGRRREEFKKKSVPKFEALHQCKRCGITEQDDPELEFRVSAADDEEYCVPCLQEMRAEKEKNPTDGGAG